MHIESANDGDGLVGARLAWVHQTQRGLAGAGAEEAQTPRRGCAADGPAGGDYCGTEPHCPLHDDILRLRGAVNEFLERTTLDVFGQR